MATSFDGSSTTPIGPIHLPRPLTSFVGREREIETIAIRLRRNDVRLVTLTGPGGVGKTRLAIQVAQEVVSDFPDGVWFIGLAPVRDPSLVTPTIARVLGSQETAGRSIVEGIAAFLNDRRALLVLDNFEHVLAAGPVLTDLLATCPELTMLVTSRAVLRLSGEHDIGVPPLASVDPGNLPPLAEVHEADAIHLFV
jgi:predicted ATPase